MNHHGIATRQMQEGRCTSTGSKEKKKKKNYNCMRGARGPGIAVIIYSDRSLSDITYQIKFVVFRTSPSPEPTCDACD